MNTFYAILVVLFVLMAKGNLLTRHFIMSVRLKPNLTHLHYSTCNVALFLLRACSKDMYVCHALIMYSIGHHVETTLQNY
jgi:hypothetical protein